MGFDVETTIKEKGHVHHPDNYLCSASFAYLESNRATRFTYFRDPGFENEIFSALEGASEVVGFNFKFDVQWIIRTFGKIPNHFKVFDCQLAEFILNGQKGAYSSLNECLSTYGIPQKLDLVKEYWDLGVDTPDIPLPILEEYNNDDAEKVLALRECQLKLLSDRQLQLGYAQGRDLLVLAKTELNGVRYDLHRAEHSYQLFSESLVEIQRELDSFLPEELQYHRRDRSGTIHGSSDVSGDDSISFNWESGDQLSALLYGGQITYEYTIPEKKVYGPKTQNPGVEYTYNHHHQRIIEFPRRFDFLPNTEVKKTKDDESATTRFYQVDDGTLSQLKRKTSEARRLLGLLVRKAKVSKVIESFGGIEKRRLKYQWGEYLHGQFNQAVAVTGRLSSSNPNMQNSDENVDLCLISRYD